MSAAAGITSPLSGVPSGPVPGAPDAWDPALPLPVLRPDLRLLESAPGQWTIHDPLAQRFYTVEQSVVELLSCWSAGTPRALAQQVLLRSGKQPADDDIRSLLRFLDHHELLAARARISHARAQARADLSRRPWWSRLLHGYLFFKIPLARPDAFLRATLPALRWMFRPMFWVGLLVLALLGLYLVSRQWERFVGTLPELWDTGGVVVFALSLVMIKTLHELGHGYTAVYYGSRVSTMGVAMIVMAPVLYTDTTDAWRLRPRRQRVLIDAAGMAVELMVATLATLVWVFVPDGPLRSAAFALATTGWVMSLAINLNPLMRFDGYYLFSDLIGLPNLQERSFAMARWWTRALLFGFADAQPEPASVARRRFLVGFAWATWIYRFFLFLGIALLVYHFFFKALGLFLFAVEIGWFIALPVWREACVWARQRREAGPRAVLTGLVLGGLLALLLVPLPLTVRIPAVAGVSTQLGVFSPRPARIEAVLVRAGDAVRTGDVLLRLSAPEIEQAMQRSSERSEGLEQRVGRRSADTRDRALGLELRRTLGVEHDRQQGLRRERQRLELRAPVDGVVAVVSEELHPGRWVHGRSPLALVIQPHVLQARGYVRGEELGHLYPGQSGRFVDEARLQVPWAAELERVADAAAESLDLWMLGVPHGGTVPAHVREHQVQPDEAQFEVTARLQVSPGTQTPTELRGELQLEGIPQSLAARMWRRIWQVLVREAVA